MKPVNKPQQPKKPYTAPRLTHYGAIRELTKSGSGTKIEDVAPGQAQPNKRP
jgi:hypothetical protein